MIYLHRYAIAVFMAVWSALIGGVLQCEWEVRSREDSHVVAVMKDGLLLATYIRYPHNLLKFYVFIFANVQSFAKSAKFTTCEKFVHIYRIYLILQYYYFCSFY